MALLLKFPAPSTKSSRLPLAAVSTASIRFISLHPKSKVVKIAPNSRKDGRFLVAKAVEESKEREKETESEAAEATIPVESTSDLGAEIKEVIKRRKEEKEGDLFSGVAAEVREIEWPAFDKVLGTTGVVLGVIIGSSVVLLTVNAVLAELSDKVFAGKGVQDFFN